MFKSLTGPMMLVFKDPGSLTAVSMYRKIGCKQTCQWIRVKQALKFPCLLHVLYFWLSDRWPNNCLINYLCHVGNFQCASCDLLFALSLEYNVFVYLLQRNIMLKKDNFHHLLFE